MYQISLFAAFIAGMVALFAPCCISYLLPTYLGNIFREKRSVIIMTVIYSLGIATVILPIVLGARALASLFYQFHDVSYAVGAALLLISAWLALLGIKLPMPHFRYQPKSNHVDAVSIYIMGLIAGITSSCCAPVLFGVLTLSALVPTAMQSVVVSLMYVAGMVAPLYLAALLVHKTNLFSKLWWKTSLYSLRLGTRRYPILISNLIAALIFAFTGLYLFVNLIQGNLAMEQGASAKIITVATSIDAIIKNKENFMNIIVNIFTLALIGFVYWFFFMKKDSQAVSSASGQIRIIASGGFKPNKISLNKGKTTSLVFHREDPSDCMAEVVIPDFGIRESLPLNKDKIIKITPEKSGSFDISCGMNMYHGKIEVK